MATIRRVTTLVAPTDSHDWCALTGDELPVGAIYDWCVQPDCGAVVLFSGTVRDHAEDDQGQVRDGVTHLIYEAYDEMVVPRLHEIAAAARSRFSELGRLVLVHRIGQLELGESSVVCAASAAHRGQAFDAARFLIDTLKATVPIWKQESWESGSGESASGWGLGSATDHRRAFGPGRLMARDLAIDLGTANTLVYARGRGIVLNEPSVIALNSQTGEVLATGQDAWHMIGRTPGYIVAVRPLRGGAIKDFDVTEKMIRLLLQRVGVSRFNRPRVVICVPSAITEVEKRAVTEAARRAGAAEPQLIEQPLAAAIGAGLPIDEPIGNMVIDIGGGTSETAVISLGGIVALEAVRVGSFDIDASIQSFVRREYGIAIGERTAEEIKVAIGSADPTRDEMQAEVRGRDLITGLPKTVVLAPGDVRGAIDEVIVAIVDSVIRCLSKVPPELSQDFLVRGVHLVGGGGMLRGLAGRLARETQVPVHLVEAPLESVVLGAGHCIENWDALKNMFMGARR